MIDPSLATRIVAAAVLAAALRPAGPGAAASAVPADRPVSVTLITGDRVRLASGPGGAAVAVRPGPGREGVTFLRAARAGVDGSEEITVVPSDAAPLLAAGLLDRQLFEVTALVRQGFGDTREAPPLILAYGARGRASLEAPRLAGVRARRELPSIGALAVVEEKAGSGAFWRWYTGGAGAAGVAPEQALHAARATGVAKVWLDGRARPLLDQTGPQIGVPAARAAGLTGRGVTVAVLDTGVASGHPDLAGRVAEARDFTESDPEARDDVGHGTHVAGILAGSGAASGGRYEGVAPGVSLLSGKVCLVFGCPFSSVIAGMEWAAPRARIVNLSLGGGPSDGEDPVSLALDALAAEHGTLFVVAAGNFGAPQTVTSPAAAREALGVGSVTKADVMALTSSRGPRVGDFAVKPDLVAPGEAVVSARAAGTPAGDQQPVDDHYARLSGTSMAAPHAAGAAALLAERHPDWSGPELKAALMGSAQLLAGATVYDQGAGRLDVARAAAQQVTATGSLSFGQTPWPHEQPAATRVLSYRNHGDATVTLALAVSVTSSSGAPAPAGLITLGAASVTVPAGGTAEVPVTFTPASRTPGLFGGWVTATAGAVALRTAVGVSQEVESYALTLHVIPRGAPPASTLALLMELESGRSLLLSPASFDAEGRAVVRVPRGTYDAIALNRSFGSGGPGPAPAVVLAAVETPVAADTTLTLDARLALPLSVAVDRPALGRSQMVALASRVARGAISLIAISGGPDAQLFATPTREVTGHSLVFHYAASLASDPPGAPPRAGEYTYGLSFVESGRIPEDLAYRARDRELAAVHTDYHLQAAPATAFRGDLPFVPGLGAGNVEFAMELPRRRTEYFTPGDGVQWLHTLNMISEEDPFGEETLSRRSYRPGPLHVGWNRAPLGPASGAPFFGAFRNPDGTVDALVSLFTGNQDGHTTDSSGAAGVAGTTSLARDGEVVGETGLPCLGRFPVGFTPGTLTLRCAATRQVPWSALGSEVRGSWTILDPGTGLPAARLPLPLLTVRARGEVDLTGTAPAGRISPLFLHVQRQAGAPPAGVAALDLEVSYDDGVTWRAIPVLRLPSSGLGLALLRHPRGEGFVSLRTRASDAAGNAVDQTVLRAYRIAPSS